MTVIFICSFVIDIYIICNVPVTCGCLKNLKVAYSLLIRNGIRTVKCAQILAIPKVSFITLFR